MITVLEINVLNEFSLNYLLIKFSTNDTGEDMDNYAFNAYRSTSPYSGFELIKEDILGFEFLDYDVNLRNPSVKYYYKIGIQDKETLKEEMSEITGELIYNKPDNIALATIYNNNVYLRVVNNPDILLLPRKRFGQKCTNCWDDIRKQAKLDDCPDCFGVGYTGGYFSPTPIKISFLNSPYSHQENIDISDVGNLDSPIQVWTGNYPKIFSGDVLADHLNQRFSISHVQKSSKNGYVLRQTLTIKKLPTSHPVYNFQIGGE